MEGNTTSLNGSYGIYLRFANNNTVKGNTASSNTWRGINLYNSSSNTLEGNTTSPNNYGGILLGSSSNNNTLNIGNDCRIGSEYKDIKNGTFPAALKNGITLIGKNCIIPEKASIGSGCYIGSGKGLDYLLRNRYLYNGESIP